MSALGSLRRHIFGISLDETTVAKRGFQCDRPERRARLETIGRTFVEGYHLALYEGGGTRLTCALDGVDAERRGFAYEGAAMGLTLLDRLPTGGSRFLECVRGAGNDHVYMMYVGAGWAAARLPWLRRRIEQFVGSLDPLLGWLALDGFGFHEGYFSPVRTIERGEQPSLTSGAAGVFDQGVGRSLWFVAGADVDRCAAKVATFDPSRHADLWAGLGLACAYAGGVSADEVERLRTLAGPYRADLAQGVGFAAKARDRAGTPAAHTELACTVLAGCSAQAAAVISDQCLELIASQGVRGYAEWRRAVRDALAGGVSAGASA